MKNDNTTLEHECKFISVYKRNNWEFVDRPGITGIAGILAITNDNKLVLVEQYREPVQKICVEVPAGLIGDIDADEPFLDGAKRELLEETGYEAGKTSILGSFPVSPGMSTEIVTFVLATDLTKVNAGGGDASENITVVEIPLMTAPAEIMKLENNGEKYIDAKVFLAAYFAYAEATRRINTGELLISDAIKPIR